MLGSPILYLKGMRAIMFQLSGFYCSILGFGASGLGIMDYGPSSLIRSPKTPNPKILIP